MSTFNLDINQCSKNEFPIELIVTGKQIYRGFISLAKTTGGIIILIPLAVATLISLPFTYILATIIFTYYSIRIKFYTERILSVIVTKGNYKNLYDIYLHTKESLTIIENFISSGKFKIMPYPINQFFKLFYRQISRANKYLEMQLFELHDPKTIPIEAIDSLKKQLSSIDHDWCDDVLWKDFQVKHHHMAN